jgi:hypothetical protein
MLRSAPSTSSFSVHIKDHALVLFLPQPEQQSLWRFDLDGLIEQAFRLTGREGYYFLTLDDLDGNSKIIARFVDKGQAESVIHALYDALTDNSSTPSDSRQITDHAPRSFLKRWFGWLTFWRLVFLIALTILGWAYLKPAKQNPIDEVAQRIMQHEPALNAPIGEAVDLDKLLQ